MQDSTDSVPPKLSRATNESDKKSPLIDGLETARRPLIELSVVAGPHIGRRFEFREADRFLVGRSSKAHFQLAKKDKYFSRSHFLIEMNPPVCQIFDLNSTNGTYVNGVRITEFILKTGDRISCGKTEFSVDLHNDPDATWIVRPTESSSIDPLNLPEIPGYEILEEIGRGGMGRVYRAIRIHDRRQVAIKTLQPAVAGTKEDYERFLREIRVLQNLDHPNIVRYLGEGVKDQLLFLVMEFVPGCDAKKLVQSKGPLPVSEAVPVTCQFLAGLMNAHQRGYVHRDIKPANLMMYKEDRNWRVKLADFGLARTYLTSHLSGCTQLGQIGGTISFMAPEQVTCFREAIPASDQYSSAATLYWLLTGKHAYDFPEQIYKQLAILMNEESIPIQVRCPEISNRLADTIDRALSRSPQKRFRSVQHFSDKLVASL